MKGSTLLKGWAGVSVALTLIAFSTLLGRGDTDVSVDKKIAQHSEPGRLEVRGEVGESKSEKQTVISRLEVPELAVVADKKPEKAEYRGEPGKWTGECKNYPGLGVKFLSPTTRPVAAVRREKDWKPWKLPQEIEDEHNDEARFKVPPGWTSVASKMGKQWFHITNFCVKDGKLTLFDKKQDISVRKKRFNLYNEFTRHRNKLSYHIESVPDKLPGPLVDNPAWILSFWCQDLFHSTLTLMPAHAIKKWNNSDIYVTLCKPKSPCHTKLGSQISWNDSYNPMWGNDKQFSYAGNPYWRMYRVLTDQPWRIRPLGKHPFYNNKSRCYKEGFIDKKWFIQITRQEAIDYSNHHLSNFGIKRQKRECKKEGGYRMTMINRQGATRKLANIQEVSEAAMCHGFNVTVVAFEKFDLREQIEIVANTDLLLGMHGNGLIWTMFQEIGAYEIEIMGSWYERYARLWGNGYNNTNTFDKYGKKGNEWKPFQADMKQVGLALARAKEHLDSTSCGNVKLPTMSESHKTVWEVCSRIRVTSTEHLDSQPSGVGAACR